MYCILVFCVLFEKQKPRYLVIVTKNTTKFPGFKES